MSKDKEKTRKIIIETKKAYEQMNKWWGERFEEKRRSIDLVRGVALGLLYGIIGNFFVQHWHPVFEGLMLGEYKPTFWANAIVCFFSLVVILYTTIKFRHQLKEDKRKMRLARESLGRTELKIEELKQHLERKT